jgi:hypothetical protein
MPRPSLVLLASTTVVATLGLSGVGLTAQTATGSTDSFAAARAQHSTRVVDLGPTRVAVTPVGDTGRSVIGPVTDQRGAPGLFLTQTSDGTTTVQAAGGGAPTLIAGTVPRAESDADPGDLVQLDFSAIARDGRDAVARVTVMDLATGEAHTRELPPDPGSTCTTAGYEYSDCVLVPPGDYSVMAFVTTMPAGSPSLENGRTVQNVALVGRPEVHVADSRGFVFDARDARRVTVDTPDHRTETDAQGTLELFYRRTAANGQGILSTYYPASMLDNHFYEQPSLRRVSIGSMETLTRLRLVKPDITLDAPHTRALHPDYYDAVWFSDVASDFPMYDGNARLRAIDVGRARAKDLRGRHLHGAIAVAERSDHRSVAEQSNAAAKAGAGLVVIYNDGPGDSGDPNGVGVKLKVPTLRLSRAEGRALTRLPGKARVKVHGEPASPYLYDLLIKEHGRIPKDLHYTFHTRDLATQVREVHGQPGGGDTFSDAAYEFQPGDVASYSTAFPFRNGPRVRTEYRIPDPETRWAYSVTMPESAYGASFPEPPVFPMGLTSPHFATYRGTGTRHLPVATAPVVTAPNPAAAIERAGDRMRVVLDGFTDADGNHGLALTDIDGSGLTTHLTIDVDGQTVAEEDFLPYQIVDLPPGQSHVSIRFTVDNAQSWNRLSTHTDTQWTFPSSTAPEDAPVAQPLLVPDYDVPVDLDNRVEAGKHGRAAFDLAIRHQGGSSAASIDDVTLDASWDGGDSWIPAAVTATDSGWHVVLPRGRGLVSLRLHAADSAGSTVDQAVVRAFLVR